MKRIGPRMVTLGVLSVLFALVTASLVLDYVGHETAPAAPAFEPLCPDVAEPASSEPKVPTLAPPRDTPVAAIRSRFDRRPQSQVVYVRVEAEQWGPQHD
jgi:hypothetical protein